MSGRLKLKLVSRASVMYISLYLFFIQYLSLMTLFSNSITRLTFTLILASSLIVHGEVSSTCILDPSASRITVAVGYIRSATSVTLVRGMVQRAVFTSMGLAELGESCSWLGAYPEFVHNLHPLHLSLQVAGCSFLAMLAQYFHPVSLTRQMLLH